MDNAPGEDKDPSNKPKRPYNLTKQRESWAPDEHERFLTALSLFHRDWKQVAAYVGTRTTAQVRSHAQKWEDKLAKGGTFGPSLLQLPSARQKRKRAPGVSTNNASHHAPGVGSSFMQASLSLEQPSQGQARSCPEAGLDHQASDAIGLDSATFEGLDEGLQLHRTGAALDHGSRSSLLFARGSTGGRNRASNALFSMDEATGSPQLGPANTTASDNVAADATGSNKSARRQLSNPLPSAPAKAKVKSSGDSDSPQKGSAHKPRPQQPDAIALLSRPLLGDQGTSASSSAGSIQKACALVASILADPEGAGGSSSSGPEASGHLAAFRSMEAEEQAMAAMLMSELTDKLTQLCALSQLGHRGSSSAHGATQPNMNSSVHDLDVSAAAGLESGSLQAPGTGSGSGSEPSSSGSRQGRKARPPRRSWTVGASGILPLLAGSVAATGSLDCLGPNLLLHQRPVHSAEILDLDAYTGPGSDYEMELGMQLGAELGMDTDAGLPDLDPGQAAGMNSTIIRDPAAGPAVSNTLIKPDPDLESLLQRGPRLRLQLANLKADARPIGDNTCLTTLSAPAHAAASTDAMAPEPQEPRRSLTGGSPGQPPRSSAGRPGTSRRARALPSTSLGDVGGSAGVSGDQQGAALNSAVDKLVPPDFQDPLQHPAASQLATWPGTLPAWPAMLTNATAAITAKSQPLPELAPLGHQVAGGQADAGAMPPPPPRPRPFSLATIAQQRATAMQQPSLLGSWAMEGTQMLGAGAGQTIGMWPSQHDPHHSTCADIRSLVQGLLPPPATLPDAACPATASGSLMAGGAGPAHGRQPHQQQSLTLPSSSGSGSDFLLDQAMASAWGGDAGRGGFLDGTPPRQHQQVLPGLMHAGGAGADAGVSTLSDGPPRGRAVLTLGGGMQPAAWSRQQQLYHYDAFGPSPPDAGTAAAAAVAAAAMAAAAGTAGGSSGTAGVAVNSFPGSSCEASHSINTSLFSSLGHCSMGSSSTGSSSLHSLAYGFGGLGLAGVPGGIQHTSGRLSVGMMSDLGVGVGGAAAGGPTAGAGGSGHALHLQQSLMQQQQHALLQYAQQQQQVFPPQ